jgi:hypothetical protein
MYVRIAAAIRTRRSRVPTFDTAVDLHHFIDTIKQASETGRELPVVRGVAGARGHRDFQPYEVRITARIPAWLCTLA